MRYLARRLVRYAMRRRSTIVQPYLNGSVLDIGCGGAFLTNFVPLGSYVGVDANENIIRRLKETKPDYEFHYINVDTREGAFKLASLDISFDTITLLAVVEHLRHPQIVFKACSQLLQDNGVLVITTPTPLGDRIGRVAIGIAKGGRKSMFPHIRLYTPQDLNKLLAPLKLKPIRYSKFLFGANQLFVYSKYG